MKRYLFIIFLFVLVGLIGCTDEPNDMDEEVLKIEEIEAGKGIALINAHIIDGTYGNPINDGVIIFKDNIIEAVGAKADVTIPNDYQQIDMKGNTVMPGFINAHVHHVYNETTLNNFLKAGITTVRALSGSGAVNPIEERDHFNQNPLNAKIVQATRIITAPNGYGTSYVSTKEEAIQRVNDNIAEGYDIIKFSIEDYCAQKVWTMLDQELINTIVETAHENNKRVAVHITWQKNLQAAIDANVDEISHMVVDLLQQSTVDQIVEKGIYWIPTLELWHIITLYHSAGYRQTAINNLRMFYESGGKVAMGTDFKGYTGPFDEGFPVIEIRFMKQAGMTNHDIIIASTKHAAIVSDRINDIGTLAVGKQADILVVEGNPLDDILLLQETFLVVHQGKVMFKYF